MSRARLSLVRARGRCAAVLRSALRPALADGATLDLAQQGPARADRRHQLALGLIVAGIARHVHAGGLRLPGDRLLARQERRHRGRQDPGELLDRRADVLGGRANGCGVTRRPIHAATGSFGMAPPDGGMKTVTPFKLLRGLSPGSSGLGRKAVEERLTALNISTASR